MKNPVLTSDLGYRQSDYNSARMPEQPDSIDVISLKVVAISIAMDIATKVMSGKIYTGLININNQLRAVNPRLYENVTNAG